MTNERYFIAIVPEEPLFSILQQLKEEVGKLSCSVASLRSPPHITLHMPFLFAKEKEGKIIQSIETSIQQLNTFQIKLKDFSFFGEKVLFVDVLNSEKLGVLQKAIVDSMRKLQIFNQAESPLGFHPHVTLAFRDLKREKFHELWSIFSSRKLEYECAVNAVCLLRFISGKWEIIHKFYLHESK